MTCGEFAPATRVRFRIGPTPGDGELSLARARAQLSTRVSFVSIVVADSSEGSIMRQKATDAELPRRTGARPGNLEDATRDS